VPVPSEGCVTRWVRELQAGDRDAAQKLWEGYFHRLVGLARTKLRGQACRAADEEDVALSAFDSFCRGAARGQFPRLDDSKNLWRLLVTLTERKVRRLLRDARLQKRGGREVRGESALPGASDRGRPTPTCKRLPCGRWKARPTTRSRPSLAVRRARSNAGCS
jgi:hypothetical protein